MEIVIIWKTNVCVVRRAVNFGLSLFCDHIIPSVLVLKHKDWRNDMITKQRLTWKSFSSLFNSCPCLDAVLGMLMSSDIERNSFINGSVDCVCTSFCHFTKIIFRRKPHHIKLSRDGIWLLDVHLANIDFHQLPEKMHSSNCYVITTNFRYPVLLYFDV